MTFAEEHPLKILVAEDSSMSSVFVVLLLKKLGYTATVATNGIEVINFFTKNPYNLILMDIQMPEMDGIAATKHIRANFPQEQQPYIVAVTARVSVHDNQRCLEAGVDEYIAKPFPVKTIEEVVGRASHFINTK